MTQPSSLRLDYAQPVPWQQRRWVRRLAIAGILLAVAAPLAYRYGPRAWNRFWVLHHQRQIMHFALPPGTVVYAEDGPPMSAPAAAGFETVARNGYTIIRKPRNDGSNQSVEEALPHCISEFNFQLNSRSGGTGLLGNSCTPFLHRRRAAPGGEWRIVHVTQNPLQRLSPHKPAGFEDGTWPILFSTTFQPATWSTDLTRVGARSGLLGAKALTGLPIGQFKLYAGQPDPNDDSHFTIRYETPQGSGTIDGWLMPDDVVKFAYRDGPALAPAPATAPATRPAP